MKEIIKTFDGHNFKNSKVTCDKPCEHSAIRTKLMETRMRFEGLSSIANTVQCVRNSAESCFISLNKL